MNKTNEGDLKCLPRDFSGRDDPRRAIISGLISSFFDVKKNAYQQKFVFVSLFAYISILNPCCSLSRLFDVYARACAGNVGEEGASFRAENRGGA